MKLTNIIWEVKKPKRKVALIVLKKNNKVLIAKRVDKPFMNNAGKWGFPGGGIDKGETAKEAAIRECEEELGIVPSNVRLLSRKGNITTFVANFPVDQTIDLNREEHDKWKMVDVETMNDYDMIEGMAETIKTALEEDKG